MSSLRCMAELCKFVWAAKVILKDEEFIKFVVDRSNEQSKEGKNKNLFSGNSLLLLLIIVIIILNTGKELKFAIVESLLRSISIDSQIANTDEKLALQVYFKQGVFYSKGEYTVEMDTKV